MSAEQTPDIERVLAEHTYMLQMSKGAICLCGFVPTVDADSLATQQDYHRAHVAQALAPVLAAAVRDALREAANDFGPNHGVARWLMDRASALDPAGFNEDDERCEHDTPAYATCEKCAALDPVPASEVRDGRADRVAEPQHEAATSGKESEASDE